MKNEMPIRNEYPRPHQRRLDWFSLNGEWDFCFDDDNLGIKNKYYLGKNGFDKKINVPFAYQYPFSGIGDTNVHESMWYKRNFFVEDLNKSYLLCFNGVDYFADVYLNGDLVGHHEGGYTTFDFDISAYILQGENTLVLHVVDPQWPDIPRGKQSWKGCRFECWYWPTSGIWKSVWVECFDTDYIEERTLFTDIDEGKVYGELSTKYALADELQINVSFAGKHWTDASFSFDKGVCKYVVPMKSDNQGCDFSLWSPESPVLYDIEYNVLSNGKVLDKITSRFGMRKISIDKNGQICLNNNPYYQRLVLDQGYFADGGLTAASAEDIKNSILTMKRMGFNGARKHQKIEDPYYYYYADEFGFLTWLEMPSAYHFSKREIQTLSTQLIDVINQNCSFTSVVTYVPLNESWGVGAIVSDKQQQAFASSLYYLIKSLDTTRLVCTNDGWENITDTDIVTIHDYCRDSVKYASTYTDSSLVASIAPCGAHKKIICNGNNYHGQPLLFSEYGGIAYDKDSTGENWGYGDGAKNDQELIARITDLTSNLADTYFQGFCYTQLTDVQQEVNGLCDPNMIPKIDEEDFKNAFRIKKY